MLPCRSCNFNAGSTADFFVVLENLILEATDLSDSEMICEILANFSSYKQVDQISDLSTGVCQHAILFVYFVNYKMYICVLLVLVTNRIFVHIVAWLCLSLNHDCLFY